MYKTLSLTLGILLAACTDDLQTSFDESALTGAVTGAVGGYFTEPQFFNTVATGLPVSAASAAQIAALEAAGGWGNSNVMTIDFSIEVLTADASTPKRDFTPTSDFFSPDCDYAQMPVPAGGNLEGEIDYQCRNRGDCHLIVHHPIEQKLYEMWRADITGSTTRKFKGGCLAIWDETKAYTDVLRGDQCTSADAAGFPIAPLLFTADEVAAGLIDHAIRIVLPNDRIKRGFVRPATHASSTTGGIDAPAYGAHYRLRADYPLETLPSEGARVVARALQTYGAYHADGGQIALTAQSDRRTTAKWAGLLGARDLADLRVSDFEIVDHGALIPLTFNCIRQ
jgi:serine/threonine-protein kinase